MNNQICQRFVLLGIMIMQKESSCLHIHTEFFDKSERCLCSTACEMQCYIFVTEFEKTGFHTHKNKMHFSPSSDICTH